MSALATPADYLAALAADLQAHRGGTINAENTVDGISVWLSTGNPGCCVHALFRVPEANRVNKDWGWADVAWLASLYLSGDQGRDVLTVTERGDFSDLVVDVAFDSVRVGELLESEWLRKLEGVDADKASTEQQAAEREVVRRGVHECFSRCE